MKRKTSPKNSQMNECVKIWETADVTRRWEPYELAENRFDGCNKPCSRRIFLFAQPRTASFTICRYFYAAGWGVPQEYFSPVLLTELSRRLMNKSFGSVITPIDISRYRVALEASRSRNSIFTTKVMWDQYSRLKASFKLHPDQLSNAVHLFLYRSDFASQVVSFWLQMKTGIYSFSDIDQSEMHDLPRNESTEIQLKKTAESLIAAEKRWFDEFVAKNWRPLVIRSEDFLTRPVEVMTRISERFQLRFDLGAVTQCEKLERNGRYKNNYLLKQNLIEQHQGLLDEISDRRDQQLRKSGFYAEYFQVK
jgi:LPS sulfotransferase NodH